ncbi:complement C1q and tumor necrosis factor-related protein 9B-like [Mercenaria mercenaria]|uniref:complement C1q and tumor necrosis factor-related protein 9B-like n=1 Tax=Mercenaria mercenaria TaxID=6596 RepID=UPI00234E4EF9|nr:complement C1q and tumor necrosis factor-related protein 9B-like [Mercenaria mercenaria]
MRMLALKLFIVLGLPLVGVHVQAASEELQDRFAYQAKLLDKMIRMEMQMERMEKELKATQTNVQTFIQNQTRILENKTAELELLGERVDLPLVAFNAYSPVDTSPDTHQIIIWQNTRLNAGNAYDTVIGIFKAPVSGLYLFAVHVCNYSGNVFQYAIVLDGTDIATAYKYDNNNYDCGSMSVITMVNSGQRVWVKCTSGSTSTLIWESTGRSSFIGALIHK